MTDKKVPVGSITVHGTTIGRVENFSARDEKVAWDDLPLMEPLEAFSPSGRVGEVIRIPLKNVQIFHENLLAILMHQILTDYREGAAWFTVQAALSQVIRNSPLRAVPLAYEQLSDVDQDDLRPLLRSLEWSALGLSETGDVVLVVPLTPELSTTLRDLGTPRRRAPRLTSKTQRTLRLLDALAPGKETHGSPPDVR